MIQGKPTAKGLTEIIAKCTICGQGFVATLKKPGEEWLCFSCGGEVEFTNRPTEGKEK